MANVTDLTNTTWYVPSGWSATAGEGSFAINYNLQTASKTYTDGERFSIGYDIWGGETPDLITDFNLMGLPSMYDFELTPSDSFTITIIGGTGVTNASLITWLSEYGELQEEEPPEEETPTEYGEIHYNDSLLATIVLGQTVVLSCKGKKAKTDIVVRNVGEVVEETPTLITFTIDGNPYGVVADYTAEEGMTFGEWVESDYNTGGLTVTGNYVYTSDSNYIMDGNWNFLTADEVIIADHTYVVDTGEVS